MFTSKGDSNLLRTCAGLWRYIVSLVKLNYFVISIRYFVLAWVAYIFPSGLHILIGVVDLGTKHSIATLFRPYFSLMFYPSCGLRNITKTCQHEHIELNFICMKLYVNLLNTFEITIQIHQNVADLGTAPVLNIRQTSFRYVYMVLCQYSYSDVSII